MRADQGAFLSHRRKAALAVAVMAAACVMADLPGRAPAEAAAAEQEAEKPAGTSPFNLDYVTDETKFILALRPAELAKLKSLASLKEALGQLGLLEHLGLPLEEIDEFRVVMNAKSLQPATEPEDRPWPILVLRAKQPHDWRKMASYFIGETEEATDGGQAYFRARAEGAENAAALNAYWFPDDRTIVMTSTAAIVRTFSLRGLENQVGWAGKWNDAAGAPAVLMAKIDLLQELCDEIGRSRAGAGEADALEAPPSFADEADVAFLTGRELSGVFQVAGAVECRSDDGAEKISLAIRMTFAAIKRQFEAMNNAPPEQARTQQEVALLVQRLMDDTKIETAKSTLRTLTVVRADIGQQLAKALKPERDAARRAQSANKMKQILLALHNYHDTHQHFPPAVVMGPDGKTPHSWRVELLPYLEKQDLYNRYDMNEPWDNEHNLALVKEAADLFAVPSEKASEDCGYFLVTGPGTLFDGNPEPAIRNVIDGTSKTIGLVEAKLAVPWTKPDDVEYDPDNPLPELGGFFEDGFNAAYLDGSVRFMLKDIDEATLRASFTHAGREP